MNIHRKPLDDLLEQLRGRDRPEQQALLRVGEAVQRAISGIEDQIEADRQALLAIDAAHVGNPGDTHVAVRQTSEETAWFDLQRVASDTRRVFTEVLRGIAGL